MAKRSRRQPNEIVLYETHAEIILYDMQMNENGRALIDLEDVEACMKHKWHLKRTEWNTDYVKNANNLMLHRFLLNVQDKNLVVDHINHNGLDNRKSNLRICNISQNGMNKVRPKNNSSGHIGVSWDKSRGKWMAHIKLNGKGKNLGRFDTFEEAVEAREAAEQEYFKEYAIERNNEGGS